MSDISIGIPPASLGRVLVFVRGFAYSLRDVCSNALAREAAAWAGVLVARRLYQLLKQKNVDLNRVNILIASLRIYQGEMYGDLPDAFPDITGILGAAILSVFPNVRHAFDHAPEIPLNPYQIETAAPSVFWRRWGTARFSSRFILSPTGSGPQLRMS